MSSSGPVKIPVGAWVSSQGFPSVDNLMDTRSAIALQSMEIASDTILSGKAKVMVAGGFDDLGEEGS